jgi:hypothetical protein
MRRPLTRVLLIVTGALIVAAVASAVAVGRGADTPKIHACVKDGSGEMRIVAAGEACMKKWSPLSWDQNAGSGGTITRTQVTATRDVLSSDGFSSVHVDCPSGSEVVGGGANYDGNDFALEYLLQSYPTTPAGWTARWFVNDSVTLRVFAICESTS